MIIEFSKQEVVLEIKVFSTLHHLTLNSVYHNGLCF